MRWPARSNSTRPSAPTSSTSPAQPSPPARRRAAARPENASAPPLRPPPPARPPGRPPGRRQAGKPVPPRGPQVLRAPPGGAAVLGNDRLDVLGANALGRALFSEMFLGPARPANFARFVFL